MIRASGTYGAFQGVTYEVHHSCGGKTAALWWHGPGDPPEGFHAARTMDNVFIRVVSTAELDHLEQVETTCSYNGGGPFFVRSVVGSTIHGTYTGTNGAWAKAQPGVEVGDWYLTGGSVDSVFDVSQVSDIEEHVTEIPLG